MSFIASCCLVGFFGDIGLQVLDQGNWGLSQYFKQHGSLESVFLATGMMGSFGTLRFLMGKPPPSILESFILGGILDIIFRYGMPMQSLQGYYDKMPVWLSLLWGGLPIVFAVKLNEFF